MIVIGDLVYSCLSDHRGLLLFPHRIGIVLSKTFLRVNVLFHGEKKPKACLPQELIRVDDPRIALASTRYWEEDERKTLDELRYNPMKV